MWWLSYYHSKSQMYNMLDATGTTANKDQVKRLPASQMQAVAQKGATADSISTLCSIPKQEPGVFPLFLSSYLSFSFMYNPPCLTGPVFSSTTHSDQK